MMQQPALAVDSTAQGKDRSLQQAGTSRKGRTMHKPNTAMRRPTRLAAASSVLLASGLALAGCSSEPEANNPAEGPTATATPTATSTATAAATSTATAAATFTGEACAYDGPSEFDADSTVTFTVTNETTDTETGFAVWKIPEGTTPEEIYDEGIFNAVPRSADDDAGYYIEVVDAPIMGEAYDLTVTFLESGQHGINCFESSGPDTGSDHVTMFTVTG